MPSNIGSIFGERLKTARKMAGLSLQDLADKMDGLVTKQALSRYELGVMEPTAKVVIVLSNALKVKSDYFFRKETFALGEVSFRKRTSLSKKEEDAIVESARDFGERYLNLETILKIKTDFKNPLTHSINSLEDVERAAIDLRVKWSLGLSPIANIMEMLETKGIKIFLVKVSGQFDGIATMGNNSVPIIVVNQSSTERMRFTAIHELAHIILMFSTTIMNDVDEVETMCHFFASCFLLPAEKLRELIGGKNRSYISIDELIVIKEAYGISLRALIHRLRKLDIISEVYYTKWMVYLTKKYGAKSEPGNFKGKEQSDRFQQLVNRAIAEEFITLNKAAVLANVSVSELTKRLGESPQ